MFKTNGRLNGACFIVILNSLYVNSMQLCFSVWKYCFIKHQHCFTINCLISWLYGTYFSLIGSCIWQWSALHKGQRVLLAHDAHKPSCNDMKSLQWVHTTCIYFFHNLGYLSAWVTMEQEGNFIQIFDTLCGKQ